MKKSLCLLVLAMIDSLPTIGQQEIRPSQVFREVDLIEQRVYQLLDLLGEAPRPEINVDISDVQPREVYSMARLLAVKANAICQAQGSERVEIPPNPTGAITSEHVFKMSLITQEALSMVLRKNGIRPETDKKEEDHTKLPTDVFKKILAVNRLLNQILPADITPSHVFVQVSESVNYVNLFIDQFGLKNSGQTPFVDGYSPWQVANQLQKCYKLLETVALAHDYQLMHLETTAASRDTRPADVYDWATILLYQLAYIYNVTASVTEIPPKVNFEEGKTPSHVYQKARELESSLNSMIGR